MFTGLVQALGTVRSIESGPVATRIAIDPDDLASARQTFGQQAAVSSATERPIDDDFSRLRIKPLDYLVGQNGDMNGF